MTSLEECNEAYKFLGYPQYDNFIPKDEFFARLEKATPRNSDERTLLMNARRCYNICLKAKTKEEADDLSQTYFDKVYSIEYATFIHSDYFPYKKAVLEIFRYKHKVNGKSIYGFQPLLLNSYLYKKKRNNGYVLAKKRHLSTRIKYEYLPLNSRDKKILTKIWFLVPKKYLKTGLNRVEKMVIEKRNQEIYSINGKYCYSKPEWDFWTWAYPWKTYAAWINPEKTEWDWVLPPNINSEF